MSVKPQVVHFRDADVLGGSEDGRLFGAQIVALWDPRGDLVLDFAGVDVAMSPFLDGMMVTLSGSLERYEEAIVAVANIEGPVRESLVLALRQAGLALAVLENGHLDVLNAREQVQVTLAAAQELGGTFQVRDLADALKIEPTSLHQRLNALMKAGAVARQVDPTPGRGRRFTYSVGNPRNLEPAKLQPLPIRKLAAKAVEAKSASVTGP